MCNVGDWKGAVDVTRVAFVSCSAAVARAIDAEMGLSG